MSDLQNTVAIIGMSGRFPGAENVEQFWRNLCEGRESIRPIADAELEDGLSAEQRRQGNYVAARALLEGVDQFDAEFFRFLPREAELTDPQQRLLIECAWEAFEDAGYDPGAVAGSVGVYAGCSINTYLLLNLASDPEFRNEFTRSYQVGSFPALVGNGHDFLATRISYKLNLRGPAMTVQSACSTALLAVSQAWQSLISYQSDLALAGASSISFPQRRGYFYQEGGMVSPDGHCRPFDSAAAGTVFGSGAGMVLLKRAEDAIADGDHIYALLVGAGVNNDGSQKIGYAAPSSQGQAEAIAQAYAVAGIDPASVGYVECHGTGTPLGDPIEVAALDQVFRTGSSRSSRCVLGSVKGNVGHLDVAAGMAGLMKAALSLERGRIPGTLHYREPNPGLNLETTPFVVSNSAIDWPRQNKGLDGVRRAGVSAFGFGGTNVHVVLEEAPDPGTGSSGRPVELFCVSARSAAALDAQCLRLAARLRDTAIPLPDAAFTLATGRRAFPHRLAVTAATREDLIAQLEAPKKIKSRRVAPQQNPRVAVLMPGQGSQYPGMGEDLYRASPLYRSIVDDCCARLLKTVELNLLPVLFPQPDGSDEGSSTTARELLKQTRYAQPALFVTSYALGRLWMEWGVEPACIAGHSVGEIAAAAIAGIFSLDDALLFVARRGEWMQEIPAGCMLAVRMQPSQLQNLLLPGLSIAALNSPALAVVSGPEEEIAKLEARLRNEKIVSRRLSTSHAFHSSMMEPVIPPLRKLLASMTLREPRIPIVSTVTGNRLSAAEARSPEYWSTHCRVPVNFSAAAATMAAEGYEIYLEAGAGDTLSTLLRHHLPRATDVTICSSLPGESVQGGSDLSSWQTLAQSAGTMWTRGVPIDWNTFYSDEGRRRVSLPTYPFERKRFWVDIKQPSSEKADGTAKKAEEREALQFASGTQDAKASGTQDAKDVSRAHETGSNQVDSETDMSSRELPPAAAAGVQIIGEQIAATLEELSGLELGPSDYDTSFLELGFDSLFLTQAAQRLQTSYGVKIGFRQLLDNLGSVNQLAAYIVQEKPELGVIQPKMEQPGIAKKSSADPAISSVQASPDNHAPTALMQQQLQSMMELIQTQLQILGVQNSSGQNVAQYTTAATSPHEAVKKETDGAHSSTGGEENALHARPVAHSQSALTAEQKQFVAGLVDRYCAKTARSKAYTEQHRRVLADPRVASGFRPEWKEMVYSIVSSRSKGSKLWDIDGNEYIDLLNGFGPTMFGHSPDFVTHAIERQLADGFAIGPQTPLAGHAAELLTEMTGCERVTFCNTGSEAVMAAMRIARTVTGRDKIVYFAGDYHGQFDEVLLKQLRRKGEISSQPAAPGIPQSKVDNIVVLDYGSEESLSYIERHADELAAVLIEPVQSRHPILQPREFLAAVRDITLRSGTAFIFDEVVTGFRIHPRGAQGFYGIEADLVTYGKVVAGGMPIGILGGKAIFMDALDGGDWKFGDSSVPEAGVTFFAGTFVRHPLTMAALCATLEHIRDAGDGLYETLNQRASAFVARMNQVAQNSGAHLTLENCGSVMFLKVTSDLRFGGLLFYLMREKGVFLLEGFPLYLTTAHTDADLDHVVRAFRESIAELQQCGLLPRDPLARSGESLGSEMVEQGTNTVTEVPLTEPQLEIVLAAQVSDEANCAFNESFRITLDGDLNLNALESAWRGLVNRHDALRMSLAPAGDRMTVDSERSIPIEKEQVDGDGAAQDRRLQQLIEDEGVTPFDLNGPLMRARLIQLRPDRHILLITAHHLVCDGWSVNIITSELGTLYSASVRGVAAKLPPALPFSEYASQSRSARQKAEEASDLGYWAGRLVPAPELLTLPADRPRPEQRSYAGSTLVTQFPKELSAALRKTGAAAGCTFFTTLLTGWQILLWRLSGNSDGITMIPAAAQAQVEDRVLVGHCVHLLPIRARLEPAMAAREYMRALKPAVLDAYEHQRATYGSIVRDLQPARTPGRLPLSEVQFNLEQLGRGAAFEGLTTTVAANGKRAVNFDVFLNIVDTGEGLRLECDYSTALYDASTVAMWLESYRTLLQGIIANPNTQVSLLPVLPATVLERLESSNATSCWPLPAANIPEMIAGSFASMPFQPAADFYGLELSRAELAGQSDRLATWLLRHGAGPGSLVGIYMDRSLEMLVAMLGVMKAGAAYVPLDPMFPAVRIEQIVEETRVPVMLSLARHLDTMPKTRARVLALDTSAQMLAAETVGQLPRLPADSLAYVIFTSGSTGRPKGVEITHGAVVNLLADLGRRLEMQSTDRWLAITTLSFDIAVLEMLLPLVTGGTVMIADRDDIADGVRLLELIEATRATVLQATPITWRMLSEQGFQPPEGFKMLCGGEAWSPALADQLLGTRPSPRRRLWNMYGPTETTVWSSVNEVTSGSERLTIGPPIANTRFYVLDERLQPVVPGVPGELVIAGAGVARGYFDRPDLTAEKFLADPFNPGERMYRTGDEVRQLEDGRIVFLGRLDQQIKLRGFRIELGEIEAAMRRVPGISDAVAVLRKDVQGEPVLAGYYTGTETLSSAELKNALRDQLPAYMIPTMLWHMQALPLTPNGKVDRRALPESRQNEADASELFEPAATPTEISLAEIFCEVLGCDRISKRANLLELGADSLRMFQIASRAHRRGLPVTARQLLQLHTVEAVAAALDASAAGRKSPAVAAAPLLRVSRENYRVAL